MRRRFEGLHAIVQTFDGLCLIFQTFEGLHAIHPNSNIRRIALNLLRRFERFHAILRRFRGLCVILQSFEGSYAMLIQSSCAQAAHTHLDQQRSQAHMLALFLPSCACCYFKIKKLLFHI